MATHPSEQLALFQPGVTDPTRVGDAEVVPILDRLRIVQMENGFSPSTRGELNEAFNLKAFAVEPGGTAKHLAEVARHQVKYGYEPGTTTTSITRDYVSYARGALTDKTMLTTLKEELAELDGANPLSAVPQTRLATGLGPLVRYKDLRLLGETKDFSLFPFSPLRPYNKNLPRTYDPYAQIENVPPAVADRVGKVLSTTRVWEAQREVELAIAEQGSRHDFWVARLGEVRRHQTGVTRAVAAQALEGFGVELQKD
jgi:hypothetical protein